MLLTHTLRSSAQGRQEHLNMHPLREQRVDRPVRLLHNGQAPQTVGYPFRRNELSGSRSREGREEKESAMQQNGEEQQESRRLQETVEHPERESEPNSAPVSTQGEQQLTEEQQKAEEYLDLLRRTQADFVNYRRRINQEQAEGRIAAQSNLLSQLLPVLDDFGRALGTIPPELATHPWVQGLFLTARRFTTLLEQLGVQ